MILVVFNNKVWTACLPEAVGTWMSSPLITDKKIKISWLACQPRISCVPAAKPIQTTHWLGQLVLLPWDFLGETGSYSLQFLSLYTDMWLQARRRLLCNVCFADVRLTQLHKIKAKQHVLRSRWMHEREGYQQHPDSSLWACSYYSAIHFCSDFIWTVNIRCICLLKGK